MPALDQVKVLSMTSPACISVRPVQWEEAAFELQEQLSSFYNTVEAGHSSLTETCAGTACVARSGSKWFRALVVVTRKVEVDTVTVRLVDVGKTFTTKIENLKVISEGFLYSPALSITCHLHGLQPWSGMEWQEDQVRKMINMLPDNMLVTLVKRGRPVVDHSGHHSLPVDLTWKVVSMPDPFMPEVVTEFSLTELIDREFGINGKDEFEDTIEDDIFDELKSEDNSKEFSHVVPLDEIENFRWLDPELPPSPQFTGRGTFVDECGQIYIQLHSQRHTVRLLRRLLNEKFSHSEPDCVGKILQPVDECCVRWRDGHWYRARFIEYLDKEKQEGLVVLVDYGNLYKVGLEDIRTTIYGQRIPIQCLRTVLAGVEPVGGTWSQGCLDFIQEKINYAKLGENYKLRVRIVEKSEAQPLTVSITDKNSEGVVVDLAQMLTMLPGEVTMVKKPHMLQDPLTRINKSLSWSVVPPGHYTQNNPYLLLCPQEDPGYQASTIPSIDWEQAGVREGQMLQVQLADVESYNCVFVQPADPACDYLVQLTAQHVELARLVQAQCEEKPPVLQPRPGLAVAVRWARDGWFRAHIEECTDVSVFVKYVDYGTRDWVGDSMFVKEMPEEWLALPALAVPVQLDIEAVEPDLDVVTGLMMECLLTWEQDMWVKVEQVGEGGKLRGHLVNKTNGDLVYKGLVKEGIIRIM